MNNYMTEATEYVVFDLEWNRPTTRYRAKKNGVKLKGEIVQIGAIKLNQELEIVDQFDIFVKPQDYHKMLKEITQIKAVPKPEARYLATTYDEDDYLSAEAFDVSEDAYKAYVGACKSKGFNQDIDEYDDMFSAKNADGISVDLGYVNSDDQLYITVEKGNE